MNRIYYDSEFTQLHQNSTLISVGLVSEAGNYFYAEFNDYDRSQLNDWLQDNVINNLIHSKADSTNQGYLVKSLPNKRYDLKHNNFNVDMVGNSRDISYQLNHWLYEEFHGMGSAQLRIYTDCYAYDWMLLVNLLSNDKTAMGMPDIINYIPIDLSTLLWSRGIDPDISREEFAEINLENNNLDSVDINYPMFTSKHNALFDTLVAKKCFEKLDRLKGVTI